MMPLDLIDICIISEREKKNKDFRDSLFDFVEEIEYNLPQDDEQKKETVIIINF